MKNSKGRFSIILPYYNGRKYIQETVESVLGQTYSNFELIIIDDGSPNKADTEFLKWSGKTRPIFRLT
jgi:glycosyltransferase involved in cell wall biosynthesis